MFSKVSEFIVKAQVARQDGQAMVEYGLILGLVSIVAIAMLTLIGTDLNTIFTAVEGALAGA